MKRDDWICLAVRGLGLFFLARTILLVPSLISAYRMKDFLLGDRQLDPALEAAAPQFLGISGITTCMGVFALAALVMLVIPCGRRT